MHRKFIRAIPLLLMLLVLTAASNEPKQYVALGDSITEGVDMAEGQRTGYVERYEEMLEKDGTEYEVTNLGVQGWTSTDLLKALQKNKKFRQGVAQADEVTLYIGTNDLREARKQYVYSKPRECGGERNLNCLKTAVDRFGKRYDKILGIIHNLRKGDMERVSTTRVYQWKVSEDKRRNSAGGKKNDFKTLKMFHDCANRRLEVIARRHGVYVGDQRKAFNGSGAGDPVKRGMVLAGPPDGIHPTDRGHMWVARSLFR